MRPLKKRARRIGEDKEDFLKRKKKIYERYVPANDYLKYFRVVRYWIKRKYDLNNADLDMLLFLYSEDMFDRERFEEYNNVIGWDTNRLNRMIEEGWVSIWRQKTPARRALYEISMKGRAMVTNMYKRLNGEAMIPESPWNPLFAKKDVCYADKVYRNFIRKMNAEVKRLRYLDRKSQQKDSGQ